MLPPMNVGCTRVPRTMVPHEKTGPGEPTEYPLNPFVTLPVVVGVEAGAAGVVVQATVEQLLILDKVKRDFRVCLA